MPEPSEKLPNDKVKSLISLYNAEKTRSANFFNLYQRAADLMYPRDDQITRISEPGDAKTDEIYNPTGVISSQEMASGLSQNLIPPGQRFFTLESTDKRINAIEEISRYLDDLANATHEHMFGSNLLLALNETLRSLVVFGTGCLFSQYNNKLSFRNYDVGKYVIMENAEGDVDTIMMEFVLTAKQAYQNWGDAVGDKIKEAAEKTEEQGTKFTFLHVVRPREEKNPRLKDSKNMPFESLFIDMKEKQIVSEGGFSEFPYHIPRWDKVSNEVFGRGQGTFAIPMVSQLQQMEANFIECANLQNHPPLEVLESFEGEVKMYPKAMNIVMERGTIASVQQQALGNFVITKDVIELQEDRIRKLFFNDIFVQLANLKGDRRTTLEIQERIGEGLQRLGPPIGRIHTELFNPLVERVVRLLVRNGAVPPPPRGLTEFKIEYVGRLALELKSHQARGAKQWVLDIGEMAQLDPNVLDVPNFDSITKRLGNTYGVNSNDMNSEDVVEAKRQARAEAQQKAEAMQMAQMAAEGYGKVSGAPEEGSPASAMMEA